MHETMTAEFFVLSSVQNYEFGAVTTRCHMSGIIMGQPCRGLVHRPPLVHPFFHLRDNAISCFSGTPLKKSLLLLSFIGAVFFLWCGWKICMGHDPEEVAAV